MKDLKYRYSKKTQESHLGMKGSRSDIEIEVSKATRV